MSRQAIQEIIQCLQHITLTINDPNIEHELLEICNILYAEVDD